MFYEHMSDTVNKQTARLALIVVSGSGPNLFGCNWMKHVCLD